MGIIDKVGRFLGSDTVKNGVREMMIVRPTDNNDLIWKHPDQTIPMFAQCTVRADEWAVFSKQGQPVGTLDACRCTLSAANIPFLSHLVDQFTGGDFLMTELFFVKRTPFPIQITGSMKPNLDPLTQVRLHPQCAGEISIRVINPELLVSHWLKMKSSSDPWDLFDEIRSIAPSAIGKVAFRLAAEQHRTVLSVLSDPIGLATAVAQGCSDIDQIGLQIAAISKFDFELPSHEFESVRLATMQQALERKADGETTMPPLVQQIFERGVREGEIRGKRDVLLRLLNRAKIPLDEGQRACVQACTDAATLDRWLEDVLGGKSAGEVLS